MLSGLKWVNLNLDTKRVTIWRGKRCYFLEMRLTLASCLDRWDEPLGLANVCGRRATDFVALQCFNDASGTLKTGLWLRVNMLRRSINVLRLHYCFRCSAVSDCNSLITQTHVGAAGRAQAMREKRRLAKPYPGQSFALWSPISITKWKTIHRNDAQQVLVALWWSHDNWGKPYAEL